MLKSFLTNRWVHMVLLLILLSGSLYMREKDYDWIKSFRYQAFDTYNHLYPRASNNQVIIANIDETSLRDDKLGQWPWPRTDVARLVKNLKTLGAKAVVFDIVFAEEDRTSPSVLLKKIPAQSMTLELKNTLQSLPDHDDLLAQTFVQAENVVTGFVWSSSADATRHLPALSKDILLGKGTEAIKSALFSAAGVTTNLKKLEINSAGNGSFGQIPDIDGIIRRVPLLFMVKSDDNRDGVIYPSLSLEALRVAEDPKNPNKIRALKENELTAFSFPYLLKRGKYEIPLDADALFYIHFSPYDESKYIPAWKIIDLSVDPSLIKDKIVLVGTSSIGLKDVRSTPLDLYVPGVDVHRNVIEQIMDGRFLSRPALMKAAELIFTGIVALSVIILAPFVNAVFLGLVSVLVIIGVNALSIMAFMSDGILIDPVYPSATILLIFFLSSLLTYIRAEIDRRSIKQAFGYYISPDLMAELTNDPSRLRLGGEIRPITVMFTDIRGFTGISEKLEPNQLIQLMNDFLTPMSDQVMSHRGTIDKYMGDAMMAFWNAPLDDDEHERHACLTALAMKKALEPLNTTLAEKARAQGQKPMPLRAGIGVNSGPAAVGNMGSRQRFAYSVLGDTVNLASRLEGQTKIYGVEILIGETTAMAVPDFATLELDLLRVKGKDKPIRIYALLASEKSTEFIELDSCHQKMLSSYHSQDWETALSYIQACEAVCQPELKSYYTMMQSRVSNFIKTPPEKDWDGVYSAVSK